MIRRATRIFDWLTLRRESSVLSLRQERRGTTERHPYVLLSPNNSIFFLPRRGCSSSSLHAAKLLLPAALSVVLRRTCQPFHHAYNYSLCCLKPTNICKHQTMPAIIGHEPFHPFFSETPPPMLMHAFCKVLTGFQAATRLPRVNFGT
jgi:hypothetical protein